jgi:hypothetical protein
VRDEPLSIARNDFGRAAARLYFCRGNIIRKKPSSSAIEISLFIELLEVQLVLVILVVQQMESWPIPSVLLPY